MLVRTKGKSIAGGHGDVLIVGDTGTGKTMSVKQLAYELTKDSRSNSGTGLLLPNLHSLHIPLVRVQCTGEDGRNLIATTGFINNTTVVKEGPIPKAIKAANDNLLAILLLDEISALPPDSQKALNEFLETGSASYQDKRWYLDPDATLFIIATTNDPDKPGYGGTNTINADLIFATYLDDALLVDKMTFLWKFIGSNEKLENKYREYIPFDTLLNTIDNYIKLVKAGDKNPLEDAFTYALINKLPDRDMQKLISQKIEEIFGIEIKGGDHDEGEGQDQVVK